MDNADSMSSVNREENLKKNQKRNARGPKTLTEMKNVFDGLSGLNTIEKRTRQVSQFSMAIIG